MRSAGWVSVGTLLLLPLLACTEASEPPLTSASGGKGGSSAGTSSSGSGGDAPRGGSGAGGASAGDGGRGGSTSGAAGATAGVSSGGAGDTSGAGSGGTSNASGGAGTSGDDAGSAGEGGSASGAAGSAGAAGAGTSGTCPNPITTTDTSNLSVDEAVETYTVTGSTPSEIRASINATRDGDYDAFTSWYLSWRYANDACDGSGLTVLVEIGYSLPEWDAPPGAAEPVVDEWNAYMDALHCHEYGHAQFGLDAANEIYTALSAIDAGGDCIEQQSLADAEFQRILDDYIALEIAYDEDTNHGATMGAVFPM